MQLSRGGMFRGAEEREAPEVHPHVKPGACSCTTSHDRRSLQMLLRMWKWGIILETPPPHPRRWPGVITGFSREGGSEGGG